MMYHNPEWDSMPWHHFNDPAQRFLVLPSFVVGELYFIFLAIVTLIHAVSHGRTHIFVWLASVCAGTANDAIFMLLPFVDNFWQAQACIMLTPRMPLYIPCVYIVFMYTSTVACWRIGLPLLASASLTGLMGEMIYAPYDLTGIKFLWWTWHDTDAPVNQRLLGVPIGSTVWVITFTATFQFFVSLTIKNEKNWIKQVVGLIVTSCFSTPVMMIQMAVLQLVSFDIQGMPSINSLVAVLVIYCGLIGFYWQQRKLEVSSSLTSWLLMVCLEWYYLLLIANSLSSDPASHLSTGVHQEIGDCNVRAADLSGHMRQVFLCPESHSQDWNLDCDELCSENMFGDCDFQSKHWYTVCGKPHKDFVLFAGVIAALGTLGSFTYAYAFKDREKRKIS